MNIFEIFDEYFLLVIIIYSLTTFFIDSRYYEKSGELKLKMYAKVLSALMFILGITLYIIGRIMGGI